jgi:hypothetical protein
LPCSVTTRRNARAGAWQWGAALAALRPASLPGAVGTGRVDSLSPAQPENSTHNSHSATEKTDSRITSPTVLPRDRTGAAVVGSVVGKAPVAGRRSWPRRRQSGSRLGHRSRWRPSLPPNQCLRAPTGVASPTAVSNSWNRLMGPAAVPDVPAAAPRRRGTGEVFSAGVWPPPEKPVGYRPFGLPTGVPKPLAQLVPAVPRALRSPKPRSQARPRPAGSFAKHRGKASLWKRLFPRFSGWDRARERLAEGSLARFRRPA